MRIYKKTFSLKNRPLLYEPQTNTCFHKIRLQEVTKTFEAFNAVQYELN